MSSSNEDEMGMIEVSQRVSRAKPPSNAVAGPSKRKNVPTSATKANVTIPQDAISISSDGETEVPKTNAKVNAKPPSVNGRSAASKGKAKAAAAPGKRRKLMDIEEADDEETAIVEDNGNKSRRPVDPPQDQTYLSKDPRKLEKQVERWQRICEEVKQQRDTFSRQIEELIQLRQTEPEKLLDEQRTQYEAKLKAQDDTIHELHNSLMQVDALAQSGTGTSLHFLTRETADKEKQEIQREITRLKGIIKEKDAKLGGKEKEIISLQAELKTSQSDLTKEIENTKALVARQPASTKQPKADPKHALVIRLYEEFTNLLITHVKHEPVPHKEDTLTYTCLNFSLKFFEEYENGPGQPQLINKVIYTPLELEKETEDFVKQLGFLADSFTFQRGQMSVFLRTLLSRLEDSDDESQMEE